MQETVIPNAGSKISTYRMKLCNNMKKPGGCRNDKDCIFAHSKHQLRSCNLFIHYNLAVADPVPISAILAYQKIEQIKQSKKQRKAEQRQKDTEGVPKVGQQFIFDDNDYQNPYGRKNSKVL